MKPLLFGTALLVLVTTSANGQERRDRHALRWSVVALVSAEAIDWSTTGAILNRGGHEHNVLFSAFHDRPVQTVTACAALDVGGLLAWHRLMRQHRRLEVVGLLVATAYRVHVDVGQLHRYRHPSDTSFNW